MGRLIGYDIDKNLERLFMELFTGNKNNWMDIISAIDWKIEVLEK